jgi:hypothetical protein
LHNPFVFCPLFHFASFAFIPVYFGSLVLK